LLFDGAKRDAVLVVNTSLSHDEIIRLVRKYSLANDWFGKLVTIRAKKYGRDMAYPMLGALTKALGNVKLDEILAALDFLGQSKKKDLVRMAYDESKVTSVRISAADTEQSSKRAGSKMSLPTGAKGEWWDRKTYREYQTAAAEADSYSRRIEAMPSWEALAPGLIEFGPSPGERNIGFKTSFSRHLRPMIDAQKCTDCKLCHIYCPDGAVDFQPIKVDFDYCQGCGICAQVCPPKAIQMVGELVATEGLNEEEAMSVSEALREYGY
jgi:pyruvate ferredoxin oxidoreductase delta subunit